MSFLVRSRGSQRWGGAGPPGGATPSFSVRTGRRFSGEGDSVVLGRSGGGGHDGMHQGLNAAHFLRNETQAARTAVEALDKYILKLASFQDKALELTEEAHRALSRLERAVALSAAPELIVVACEIKVACHRGLHLFRTYGRYRYLGKVIALATHSSITAKFDAVIARLTAIMPMDKTPSFTSIRAAADAAAAQQTDGAAAAGKQLSARNSLEEQLASPGEAGQQPQHQRAHSSGGGSSSSGPAALTVAAGSLANRLKGSSSRAGADGSLSGGPSSPRHKSAAEAAAAGATVLSVVLRSTDTSKVTCISFGDTPGASAGSTCIWWAAGDSLEFYSTSTQSTTSFAPHAEKAAITAVAVDSVGNIWCANSKGAVMMRQQRNWEQVFVEHAFASCVRCLATDADSDVVWAGDEAGRLAVLRFVDANGTCHLECTATILPGKAGGGMKASNSSALLDVKPKAVSRWQALSCRSIKDQQGQAEGPIRVMLIRDDRAWVGGGRTDPWIGLFDAVLGTQLDMWSCGQYGACMAMTSMLTSDALSQAAAAAAAAAATSRHPSGRHSGEYLSGAGIDVPMSVPEDNIGEDPRSSWRLITGHETGQLLLWNAAADKLQPVVKIGEPGLSPVRALCVLEEQGLLAVVHANGELGLFLRPARDRDWLLGPTTATTTAAAAGAAAAGGTQQGDGSNRSGAGAVPTLVGGVASQGGEPLSPTFATAAAAAAAERNRSGGGGGGATLSAAAGLATIKPRRVVLRSHRSMLVAAAANSSGVVTANSTGSIKLWPAEGLGKEAERCGLLPSALLTQGAREASLSRLSNSRNQPMGRQASDSLTSNARSPFENSSSRPAYDYSAGNGVPSASAGDAAGVGVGAAAAGVGAASGFAAIAAQQQQQQQYSGSQQGMGGLLQQQDAADTQLQQQQAALMASWHHQQQQLQQQHMQQQDSMMHPNQQLYGVHAYHQQQQQQQHPNLARLSEPGLQQWMQQPLHQQQQQQQHPQAMFLSGPGNRSEVLSDELTNPLVLQQQRSLERRSAPLDIPWQQQQQAGLLPLGAAAAASASGMSAGRGSAGGMGAAAPMFGRLTAQHQLGQLGSSPRFSSGGGGLLAEAAAGSLPAGSLGGVVGYGAAAGPHGAPSVPDVPLDVGSAPRYAAPRAPKAVRERENNRERRRSERRLSKGANIAWSTCQIINASELRILECIGGGAYGQVFLAEWMGTQVAAKQLLSFQNKAKDEVTKRKANAARAQSQGDPSRDDHSDTDSDTDSVDSVEEEVAAELKQLMDEVWVLGSLSHPSISRFCALCLDPPTIVMQYYPHGSLFDLLKRGRRGEKRALHELTWQKRLDMLRDISSGMVFLHSRKPPIVHGDLRSPNLLLDLTIDRDRPRFHVKIADFGLARMVGPANSIAVSKITNPRWSAPEVLRNNTVSLSADVFSYAIVMWELLTWQQPYEEMMSVQVLFSVMQNFRPEIPPESELPGKPGTTLPRYIQLMERCWAEDEHTRPTFEEILAELDDLRSSESSITRFKAEEAKRSMHSSTRGSFSEAPGTPTGSCLGGSSVPPSQPDSANTSAPGSGRESGSNAVFAAPGATAGGPGIVRRGSQDAYLVGVQDLGNSLQTQQQQQQSGANNPAGTFQAWKAAAEPASPGGSGSGAVVAAAGVAAAAAGRHQLADNTVGSSPPSSGSGSGSGSASSAVQIAAAAAAASNNPPANSSPPWGQPPGSNSELSFAMRAAPVLGTAAAAGGLLAVSATGASPGPPSPGALHTPSRLGPRGSGDSANAAGAAAGGAAGAVRSSHQRVSSSGAPPGSPSSGSSSQQAQAHMSRLQYHSWGTLEGSLQSSGSAKLGSPVAGSLGGGTQDGAQGSSAPAQSPDAAAAAGRPYSPFSAVQSHPHNPFASPEAQQGGDVTAAAAVPPNSPFAAARPAVDARPPALDAAAAVQQEVAVPPRPASPFAAVQQDVPAAGASGTAAAEQVPPPPRPYSPFAAAQQDGGLAASSSSVAADDSAAAAAAQQPARPFSPLANAQPAAGAGANGTTQQTQAPPAAPARPHSPFAAAQEQPYERQASAAAVHKAPHLMVDESVGSLRHESLSGSPFASLMLHSTVSSGAPSAGVGEAAAAAAASAHGSSRLAVASGSGSVIAAQGGQQSLPQQQQEQQWRVGAVASPFASVNAAAVGGPIVTHQVRAALSGGPGSTSSGSRRDNGDASSVGIHSNLASGGHSPRSAAAAAVGNGDGSGSGSPSPRADRPMFAPIQSFVLNEARSPAAGAHQRPPAHGWPSPTAAAGGSGPACGSPVHSGPIFSGESITFPSGLGAVESVVFMPTKQQLQPEGGGSQRQQ